MSTLLPAPLLLAPAERQEFTEDAKVVLTWQPVGELPPDAYYEIIVAYSHLAATWHDEVPWTQDTSWTLSEHRYLLDLSDDGQFQWSVQVVRQTGVEDDGTPVGVPLSSPSEVRTFLWRRTYGGGGKPPEKNTPPVPPP
jgi:hypothetical protein